MEERREKQVHLPHDKGYKRDLSKPKEMLHFLQKYVGADWTKELTEDQLVLCDKEFIEKDYEGKEADLLYQVNRKDGRKIYIFILQELQSTVDYTMIFRLLIYIMNTLLRFFLSVDPKEREKKGFRLPAVVPIVFYNGKEPWTAVRSLKEYQCDGSIFGTHVLDLEYYLVDLSEIEEDYILSTNTVLDNIMYCDKVRRQNELTSAVQKAYARILELGKQEIEEFDQWVQNILLSICNGREDVISEILNVIRNGDGDMAFKHGIILEYEENLEKARVSGIVETCKELGISVEETVIRVMEKSGLSEEKAREYTEKYWSKSYEARKLEDEGMV